MGHFTGTGDYVNGPEEKIWDKPERAAFVTICSWCGKLISKRYDVPPAVSHGICKDCEKVERKKAGLKGGNDVSQD